MVHGVGGSRVNGCIRSITIQTVCFAVSSFCCGDSGELFGFVVLLLGVVFKGLDDNIWLVCCGFFFFSVVGVVLAVMGGWVMLFLCFFFFSLRLTYASESFSTD